MKLFKVFDVIRLCLERFGNVERLEEYQSKLADRPATRVEKRTKILSDALAKVGLKIRSDSELFLSCNIAISKLDWVVEKMAQMKYLHEYSEEFKVNYARVQQQRSQDLEFLQDNWDDPDAHHEYHSEWDGERMVDLAAVGIKFPKVWPWLQEGANKGADSTSSESDE